MITEIKLSEKELRKFRNIRMLENIHNAMMSKLKSLNKEIKDFKDGAVAELNSRHGVTAEHDFVYDEVNDRVIHCKAHEGYLNSKSLIIKMPDSFDLIVEKNFESLLKYLSKEYQDQRNSIIRS